MWTLTLQWSKEGDTDTDSVMEKRSTHYTELNARAGLEMITSLHDEKSGIENNVPEIRVLSSEHSPNTQCHEGRLHHTNTSSSSIESGYGSKKASRDDSPGSFSVMHTALTPTNEIPVERPLLQLDDTDHNTTLPATPERNATSKDEEQIDKDSPVKVTKDRRSLTLPLPQGDIQHLQDSETVPRKRSFSENSPLSQRYNLKMLQSMGRTLYVSHSDSDLLRSKRRKTASQLKGEDETRLEKMVTKKLKDFVQLTDFVILMATLGSKRLITSSDAEYLMNDKHTSRQKANYFYIVALPKKGPKAYRLLYESLSEEEEHRGHRALLHILDKAVGYEQDSSSESSSSGSSSKEGLDSSESGSSNGGSVSPPGSDGGGSCEDVSEGLTTDPLDSSSTHTDRANERQL